MRTSLLLLFLAAALVAAAPAAAKGPSEATLSGPGIDDAGIVGGEAPGTPLGDLVQAAGYFPAVFGQHPDPMTASPPPGDLGPRYSVAYTVPGPDGSVSRIVQDLYPYADAGPVTYTKPGQPVWDGQRTLGGWYAAPGELAPLLGLPADAPPATGDRTWRWRGAAAAALALVPALALLARRFPRPRPATT